MAGGRVDEGRTRSHRGAWRSRRTAGPGHRGRCAGM